MALAISTKMAHGIMSGGKARVHRIKKESGMNRIIVAVLLSAT
jgi:hypothetical protein